MAAAGEAAPVDSHLRPFFEVWLDTFTYRGRLDPKLRELAILRIMWRCGRAFEWGNHYRYARQAGVSREEVVAIRTPDPARDLEGPLALVVLAADEMVDAGCLRAGTLSSLERLLPDPSLRDELIFLLAGYRMFAAVSASKREPYRGSHRPWPPDGVGPSEP